MKDGSLPFAAMLSSLNGTEVNSVFPYMFYISKNTVRVVAIVWERR